MKTSRLLAMMSAAAVLALAACGPTEEVPTGGGGEGGFIKTETHISFWHTFGYVDEINNIIEDFRQVEPNIVVESNKINASYTELKDNVLKGIPAGNYGDIVLCYPDHVAEYLESGKAVNMEPYMNDPEYGWTAEDNADLLDSFIDEGRHYSVPGVYSLPLAKSTEAMFYNEELIGVDLSGIDPEINGGKPVSHDYLNNMTWEELYDHFLPAFATYNDRLSPEDKIYDPTGLDYHGLLGYDSDENLFITLAQQYGYGYTDVDLAKGKGEILFNNDDMKGLMRKYNEYFKKDYIMTQDTCSAKNGRPNNYFVKRGAILSVGSTGGSKYQRSDIFNVGVARIPHAAGRDPYVINQGPSVVFMSHGNDEEGKRRSLASWLFYKFMTDPEHSLRWSLATGYMPIRLSSYQSDQYMDYSDVSGKPDRSAERLNALNAAYVGTVTGDLFASPVFKGSSEARTQVGNVMARCLMSENIEAEIDSIFDEAVQKTLLQMN